MMIRYFRARTPGSLGSAGRSREEQEDGAQQYRHAHWEGDLTSGAGTTTLESGATGPLAISWRARTEEHGGLTSPEELIAAAHASCYSMALSAELARSGRAPKALDTEATPPSPRPTPGGGSPPCTSGCAPTPQS